MTRRYKRLSIDFFSHVYYLIRSVTCGTNQPDDGSIWSSSEYYEGSWTLRHLSVLVQ